MGHLLAASMLDCLQPVMPWGLCQPTHHHHHHWEVRQQWGTEGWSLRLSGPLLQTLPIAEQWEGSVAAPRTGAEQERSLRLHMGAAEGPDITDLASCHLHVYAPFYILTLWERCGDSA